MDDARSSWPTSEDERSRRSPDSRRTAAVGADNVGRGTFDGRAAGFAAPGVAPLFDRAAASTIPTVEWLAAAEPNSARADSTVT
jgi:hypothetical protein